MNFVQAIGILNTGKYGAEVRRIDWKPGWFAVLVESNNSRSSLYEEVNFFLKGPGSPIGDTMMPYVPTINDVLAEWELTDRARGQGVLDPTEEPLPEKALLSRYLNQIESTHTCDHDVEVATWHPQYPPGETPGARCFPPRIDVTCKRVEIRPGVTQRHAGCRHTVDLDAFRAWCEKNRL